MKERGHEKANKLEELLYIFADTEKIRRYGSCEYEYVLYEAVVFRAVAYSVPIEITLFVDQLPESPYNLFRCGGEDDESLRDDFLKTIFNPGNLRLRVTA